MSLMRRQGKETAGLMCKGNMALLQLPNCRSAKASKYENNP